MTLLIGLLVGIVVISLVFVASFTWLSMKRLSDSSFVLKMASTFHLPMAKVNGSYIKYTDYIDDLAVIKKVYGNQTADGVSAMTDEQISDQVFSRLIANELVANLSKDFSVKVEKIDMDNEKTKLLANFTSEEEADNELKTRYGWDLNKYMDEVVYPYLREQKLQEAVKQDTSDKTKGTITEEEISASHILFQVAEDGSDDVKVKASAKKVLDRIKAGEDFATLAEEFGSDSTKETGGSLGWFGRGQMVAEFEDAVFALEKGNVGDELVKTQFGYHIVKLDDRRTVNNFVSFMDNELRKAILKIYLPVHNPFEDFLKTEATSTAT